MTQVHFTIRGEPIGKPRQTRSDVWKKRPCVMKYRAWADEARRQAPKDLPMEPTTIHVLAYFTMPESWSKKKRAAMVGNLHQSTPDVDNCAKSLLDALWKEDKSIAILRIEKRWVDKEYAVDGARMEVVVT